MDDLTHNVAQEFGLNLLLARKRAKLSQEELGFRASLHRTEISQLEKASGWLGSTRSSSSRARSPSLLATC